MFENNSDSASDQSIQEFKPRKAQKPRHPFDRDVVRPEVYNNSIQSRFDSPGRRSVMQERIKALGLTDNDVRRLRSHHKVETFICLGSDSPLRLIDLLCLNEPELRSLYLEATEARKYQSNQLDRYQELLSQATTTFEKDNLLKSINTVQTVLGLYCAFENTARDVLKCPKTARQTLLAELKAAKDADPNIYQQHKEMREKLAEVKAEKTELKKQVESLKAELEEAKKNTSTIDPHKHEEFLRRLSAINQLTSGIDFGDNDWVSDVLPAVIEDCKRYPDERDVIVESGKTIHSSYACRAMALEFLKQKQKDTKYEFYGEENGKFNHGDVMAFLSDVVNGKFKWQWDYAANDLDLVPCGTKTYIADRMSTALVMLVNEGLLVRKAKGSHTLWAKDLINF